ncbi:MAG: hypothetical protein EOP09_01620 [Proteobacteria bacterium]|nr:MAG: hypothetical protein EOP09_01620 [Pseudomonadota bacterium]
MLKPIALAFAALAISVATISIRPPSDERAIYGTEGSAEQNAPLREVAGWPAPFIADDPGSSVTHRIGLEDNFRFGPFVATWSFWFLALCAVANSYQWIRARRKR